MAHKTPVPHWWLFTEAETVLLDMKNNCPTDTVWKTKHLESVQQV